MRYLTLALLALGLAGCGGTVIDANSTPSSQAQASPGASPSASACSGADASVPAGQADTFDEGKSAAGTSLAGGLQYVDLAPGGGPQVQNGQCLTVHYSLFLADGTPVESSRNTAGGGAFKFTLGAGSVIPGFDQGVAGMNVGGRRRITVPPGLGYGVSGQPPKIPGNATLVFVIQVLKAE